VVFIVTKYCAIPVEQMWYTLAVQDYANCD